MHALLLTLFLAGKAVVPPADLKSLDKFVADATAAGRPFRLSLRQLALDARRGGLSARRLHGFTWVFGYVIEKGKDVHLLGLKDPSRPPLELDCLVTALRAAWTGEAPACSLEKADDPAWQRTVVLGVPWKSRWAEAMVEADYDMKKIAQGLAAPGVAGVVPWFDQQARALEKGAKWAGARNRWVFDRPSDGPPRALTLDRAATALILVRNPVELRTEKAVDGKYGGGGTSPEAARFAAQFTRHMEALGDRHPSVGRLLALYRLIDLAAHLREIGKATLPEARFWLEDYKSHHSGPERRLKSLTRRVAPLRTPGGDFTFEVRGGVRMPAAAGPVRREDGAALIKRLLAK